MRKGWAFCLLLLFLGLFTNGQKNDLLLRTGDKGPYLDHKVAPKESFFSIGRLYNVHPRHLASFNRLDISKGLQIDQRIRIPLSDTNFTQKGNTGTPVYYKTAAAASLSEISKQSNGVNPARIKAWNKLGQDQVKKDSRLIVGFLLSKEMRQVTIQDIPEEKKQPGALPEKEKPAVTQQEPVKENIPPPAVVTPSESRPGTEPDIRRLPPEPAPGDDMEQGYFRSWYESQVKQTPRRQDETVTGGIFKTASGWQDAKFYILIDNVEPGTVIKVSNPANTKIIYAKVLGGMSGIRQNEGFNVRISNAAAARLQITETEKFILKISY
ncbi:MAG: LysM peptidoglycan-binding domain-containing protein [Chitinophagaceae bacterium]|nr:LysM peptidoglycan-binding domain-containing protein [Chitinophagaceae bacterium]